MLCELLAELFGRGHREPPLRTLATRAPDPPREEPEQEIDSAWFGSGPAGTAPTEHERGVTEFL
jgi:hypothetical protein